DTNLLIYLANLKPHVDALALIHLQRYAANRRLAKARHFNTHLIRADLERGNLEESVVAGGSRPFLLSAGVENGDGRARHGCAGFVRDGTEDTGAPLAKQAGGGQSKEPDKSRQDPLLIGGHGITFWRERSGEAGGDLPQHFQYRIDVLIVIE